MLEEKTFTKIIGSSFVMMHNTMRKKIEKRYLQIHKYLQIEICPKTNILSVM